MKKLFYLALFLLCTPFIFADNNLYLYDSLDLTLNVDGGFELIDQGNGQVSNVKTDLLIYPEDSFRQTMVKWESTGIVKNNTVMFEWQDKKIESKKYGFKSQVQTKNQRIAINKKIPFPLTNSEVKGLENYLEATKTIDKNNQQIITQATKLAEGEDDLFKVVFELAKWVEANINYELDTLTATTSQKASWVLENKRGVCDEMTSLFIAMARSLGIPARFVSGISYSTSDLFDEPWLPHGWAEVYFPGFGWVGFDITFGEYGYVDVTHIKLRDGFDPAEPSTKFEWLASNVLLKSSDLKFAVKVDNKGSLNLDDIFLNQEILGKEVGFGSYNLVKGTVQNKGNYYAATTLNLAVPKEISIEGDNQRVILLKPQESKEVFWKIKITDQLKGNYWYEFPVAVYSEKNVSIQKKFKAMYGKISYSKEEVDKLMTLNQEEKTYSQKVDFECKYESEMKLDETKEFSCQLKNKGNTNLKEVNFCMGNTCKKISSLLINQVADLKIQINGEKTGWQKILVKASNQEVEKITYLEYAVLDQPKIDLQVTAPKSVDYNKDFEIYLNVSKNSFSNPLKLKVLLQGNSFENKWEINELKDSNFFLVKLNSQGLGKRGQFKVSMIWEDKLGTKINQEKTILIEVKGKTFKEKIIIWFNGLISIFNLK